MTHDPKMVERVARAMFEQEWPSGVSAREARWQHHKGIWMRSSEAALKAACHKELVEALTDAREAMMKLDGGGMQPADYLNLALRIDALLAKIGAEQ